MDLCNFSWFSFCPAVFLIQWHPQAIYSSSVFFCFMYHCNTGGAPLQCNSVNIAAAWSRRKPPDSYCKCKTMDHVFSTLLFSIEWKSQHYILYCFVPPEESQRNYNLFNLFMQLFRLTSLVQTNSTNSTDIDSTLYSKWISSEHWAWAAQISCRAALTDWANCFFVISILSLSLQFFKF